MYILSVLAVIISAIFMSTLSTGGLYGFNIFNFLFLFIICIPILISSNLLKDFNNSFRIIWSKKKEVSLLEVKRAREAVTLAMKAFIFAAIFISTFYTSIMLRRLNDPASLGPNLSTTVSVLLYGVILNIFLLPIKSKLKIKEIEYMQ